jgi:hypothetical protein
MLNFNNDQQVQMALLRGTIEVKMQNAPIGHCPGHLLTVSGPNYLAVLLHIKAGDRVRSQP